MTFKDFIKILNVRDDVVDGIVSPQEAMRKIPDQEFKLMFWGCADLFKTLKAEAERRGLWEEMTRKRDT